MGYHFYKVFSLEREILKNYANLPLLQLTNFIHGLSSCSERYKQVSIAFKKLLYHLFEKEVFVPKDCKLTDQFID